MDAMQIAVDADAALADALSSGDLERAIGMYTADCRMLPPGGPMTVGRDGVRGLVSGLMGKSLTIRYEQIQVEQISEQLIMSMGRGIGTLGGEPIHSKHILLLRREVDGVWRLAADIYNFDEPGLG